MRYQKARLIEAWCEKPEYVRWGITLTFLVYLAQNRLRRYKIIGWAFIYGLEIYLLALLGMSLATRYIAAPLL